MKNLRRYINGFRDLPVVDRTQMVLATVFRFSLVVAFVVAFAEAQWTVAFVSIAALAAMLLPLYLAESYEIHVPIGFEFILTVFVYASLFLGEVHAFYTRLWWWDVVLHAGSGAAIGFIGFLILYSLHREGRFQAQPLLIAFLSFAVALSIGALWEIFEFTMDSIFGFTMQKTGLVDTMWDLIVDAVGALIAATAGYLYLRYQVRGFGLFRYYLESYFAGQKHRSR